MLPIFPVAIDIAFRINDTPVIIRVTIQAHPLPLSRPQATARLAIPTTIRMDPSTGIKATKPIPPIRKRIPLIIISIAIIVIPIGLLLSNSLLNDS